MLSPKSAAPRSATPAVSPFEQSNVGSRFHALCIMVEPTKTYYLFSWPSFPHFSFIIIIIIIGSIPKAWRCLHSPKYAPSNQQTKPQITNNN